MTIRDYYSKEFDYCKHRIDGRRIDRWLRYVPSGTGLSMLDVGCGIGDSAEWARQHGVGWLGIDISPAAVAAAQAMGRDVWDIDAQYPPFQDNTFDIIVALGSIEHMDFPSKALHEMYKALKPSGHAVILVPNRPVIESWGLYHGTFQPHELRLDRNQWSNKIVQSGLAIQRVRRDYGPSVFKNLLPHKIVQRIAVKLTRFLPDCFVYCWIFDCRKDVL